MEMERLRLLNTLLLLAEYSTILISPFPSINPYFPSTFPSASFVSSLNDPSLASYPTVYVPSSLISLTCLMITTGATVVVVAGAAVISSLVLLSVVSSETTKPATRTIHARLSPLMSVFYFQLLLYQCRHLLYPHKSLH